MLKRLLIHSTFVLLIVSCSTKQEKNRDVSRLRMIKLKGVVVPEDSLKPPFVRVIDETKLKSTKPGNPEKIISQGYIFPAGEPNVSPALAPESVA